MSAKKRGRASKDPAAFSHVLFVRCSRVLLDSLDAVVAKERKTGNPVSRSDVARRLLFTALERGLG